MDINFITSQINDCYKRGNNSSVLKYTSTLSKTLKKLFREIKVQYSRTNNIIELMNMVSIIDDVDYFVSSIDYTFSNDQRSEYLLYSESAKKTINHKISLLVDCAFSM